MVQDSSEVLVSTSTAWRWPAPAWASTTRAATSLLPHSGPLAGLVVVDAEALLVGVAVSVTVSVTVAVGAAVEDAGSESELQPATTSVAAARIPMVMCRARMVVPLDGRVAALRR